MVALLFYEKAKRADMYGVLVNAAAILVGGLLGLLLRGGISARFRSIVSQGLALCVTLIGVTNAIKTSDMMCVYRIHHRGRGARRGAEN